MAGLIYIASPYTHPDMLVRALRYEGARLYAETQLLLGNAAFSPIVYGKQMEATLGYHFEAWANLNDKMIHACEHFHVLCIAGWEESRGIAHEIKLWESLGREPITYIKP